MRILYVVQTEDFPLFLPTHKSAPENSSAYSVTLADDVTRKRETWNVAGFGDWLAESMALPVPEPTDPNCPSVMTLILPNR
jgi:hypothetical protein